MQMEMEEGGKLFFDLFVAMCNHMVSLCLQVSRCCVVLLNLSYHWASALRLWQMI